VWVVSWTSVANPIGKGGGISEYRVATCGSGVQMSVESLMDTNIKQYVPGAKNVQ
jgi:hypothetical protein